MKLAETSDFIPFKSLLILWQLLDTKPNNHTASKSLNKILL